MSKIPSRFMNVFFFWLISSASISQNLKTLQLESAYQKQENINSSEFIETLNYIPLETSPDCLIGANPKIYMTDKYFIILDNQNHCYLFDKSNGKYIRQIGHYGKDPGGYRSVSGLYNELTSTLYFSDWKQNLIKYSLDGKEIGSVPIPNYNDDFTLLKNEVPKTLKNKITETSNPVLMILK